MAKRRTTKDRQSAGRSRLFRIGKPVFAACCAAALALLAAGVVAWEARPGDRSFARIVIGSKEFPESIILGEMIKYLALDAGAELVKHEAALGGTDVVWSALVKGQIDVYVEYEATLRYDTMGGKAEVGERLAERGIKSTASLGFQNSYGLGMSEALAAERGIEKISDLALHRDLVYGLTREFQRRTLDGWEPLKRRYEEDGHNFTPDSLPVTVEHVEAYRRLQQDPAAELQDDQIQVTDIYTTDAEIAFHDVRVLRDDVGFFPSYDAILLYCVEDPRSPCGLGKDVPAALRLLQGRISVTEMRRLNGEATRLGQPVVTEPARRHEPFVNERISAVAQESLERELGIKPRTEAWYRWRSVLENTGEHIFLVLVTLAAGLLLALPVACLTAWNGVWVRRSANWLWLLPPPAVLAIMRALPEKLEPLSRGAVPALLVLLIFAVHPLLRQTSLGLREKAKPSDPPLEALRLACPWILNGLRRAAPLVVAIAILGTIVDAGGYGGWIRAALEPRFDNPRLGLWGAFPAIVMTFAFWFAIGRYLNHAYPEYRRLFSSGEMPKMPAARDEPSSNG